MTAPSVADLVATSVRQNRPIRSEAQGAVLSLPTSQGPKDTGGPSRDPETTPQGRQTTEYQGWQQPNGPLVSQAPGSTNGMPPIHSPDTGSGALQDPGRDGDLSASPGGDPGRCARRTGAGGSDQPNQPNQPARPDPSGPGRASPRLEERRRD